MSASVYKRLEEQWCDENQRQIMMSAWGSAEHPAELEPAPAQWQEQRQQPVPVAAARSSSSPSSVAPVPAIRATLGAVPAAAPSDGDRCSFLPRYLASSSSRSSDGVSGRDRRRDRGDRSCESSAGLVSSRTRRRLARTDTEPPRIVLDGDESRAAPASAPVSRGHVGGRQRQFLSSKTKITALSSPRSMGAIRKAFHRSLARGIPFRVAGEPLSADAHPIPPHTAHTDNRFGSPAAVELLLRENGIQPTSQLKPQDAALADATPDVTPARFTVLFGGHPMHERPNARARNILCVDPVVQPYAPSSPGESGVIFFAPGTILHEDDFPSFHIFLNISPQTTNGTKRSFYYLGAYCKVPSASKTVEVEEWLSLPVRCRTAWSRRIHSTAARDVRAIHARISIRNGRPHGPSPSQDEIEKWIESHPKRHSGLQESDLTAAFNKGEEKMHFTLVKCIGYDIGVAMRLQ